MMDVSRLERAVVERSRADFDAEWGWMFDGLPFERRRARLVSRDGVNWLEVSFLSEHGEPLVTEKYLLRDMLMHLEDYAVAISNQCRHAMRMVMETEDERG